MTADLLDSDARYRDTVPSCDTPTGMVLMVMVGDDRRFSIDPTDCTMIADEDYCASCGQIGCKADGR